MAEPESVADKALKKLADQLECCICRDSFTDPKMLQCFHVFCKNCLEPLVIQDQHGASLHCPNCRRSTPLPASGVSGLQSAFHIHGLFEIQDALKKVKHGQEGKKPQCEKCKKGEASGFCRDCGKFVCEVCVETHRTWEEYSNHKMISLEELKGDATEMIPSIKKPHYCSKHPEKELKYYCQSDEELICSDCVVTTHRDHRCCVINEAFSEHRDNITAHLEPVKQHLSFVNKAIQDLAATEDEITNQKAAIEANIQTRMKQLHEALEMRKTELIGQLDQMTQQKLKTLSIQRDELELIQTRLNSCLQFVSDSLEVGSKEEILAMEKQVVQQITELCTEYDPEKLRPLEETDIAFTATSKLLPSCQQFGTIFRRVVCPEKCYISRSRAASLTVGEQRSVSMHTIDADGSEYTKPLSDASISCKLVPYGRFETLPLECSVKPTKSGEYEVSYQPTQRGMHDLHIRIWGKHIRGSPFTVVARGRFVAPIRTITGIKGPWGVAINSRGQIIVAEREGHCISIYESNGEKVRSFGGKGGGQCQFYYLHDVAVDSEDNIIATDGGKNHVQKFTAEGKFMEWVASNGSPCRLDDLLGICISPSNKVYVCDRGNHQVHVLKPSLEYTFSFGSKGSGARHFHCPWNVASDKRGKLYIADSENHCIQVFTEDGHFVRKFEKEESGYGELDCPAGIAIDSDDMVYVTEINKHRISLFTSEGRFLRSFGSKGRGSGQFNQPHGIAVDKDGLVYICDYGNNRLQIW